VRVQTFNDENPYHNEVLIHGTNTDRFDLKLGRIGEGEEEARLVFHSLNLLPGRYRVSAGLWPGEDTGQAFDILRGEFIIKGNPDELGAKVFMPAAWEAGETADGVGAGNSIEEMTLEGADRAGPLFFNCREHLLARVRTCLSEPEQFVTTAVIYQCGNALHRSVREEPLPRGRGFFTISYRPLNLLEGNYLLVTSLIDRKTGRQVSAQHAFFRVRSERADGAGAVFLPCSWKIAPIPAPDRLSIQ